METGWNLVNTTPFGKYDLCTSLEVSNSGEYRGHDITPTQTTHCYFREIPKEGYCLILPKWVDHIPLNEP